MGTRLERKEVIYTKLKPNQLELIQHLCQFNTLDYASCLQLLDTANTGDKNAMSYVFRPLTKNKYISKHENGNVTILARGRALFPKIKPLATVGGGSGNRVNSISRTAAILRKIGIEIVASPAMSEYECFIPSTCWRKIRHGILSTVRFTGMLFIGSHKLAIYDIGDGSMEWQLRAEKSLFYSHFNEEFDTTATGMLFICDNDKRIEVAKSIIRHTMRQRKMLIEHESYEERTRPVKYAKAPIRVSWRYGHVYLTTPKLLAESLEQIKTEETTIEKLKSHRETCYNSKWGDFEDKSCRYFVNTATDLLKYVYFFTEVKSLNGVNYGIIAPPEDIPIIKMYPKIMEGVKVYEY